MKHFNSLLIDNFTSLFLSSVFIGVSSFVFAQPGSGCSQGSACPSDAAFVQPCDWGEADGGSPGCDPNSWKHEDGTATDNAGGCQSFIDDNDCDLVIWTDPIDLNCAFCADFNIQIDPGDEGIAFTMFNTSNMGANFPCSTPIACDGNGASDPSAEGGNLGWSPTFDDASTSGGGAITIEYDIQNNAPDDDDLVNGVYCPHVSINEDGCNNFALQSGCADGTGGMPDLTDGLSHTTSICWDPVCGELIVSIDGVQISALQEDIRSYFATSEVYFVFSSGYSGGDGSVSTVCNFAVSSPASSCVIPAGTLGPDASNCAAILPIELVSFTGEAKDSRTVLLDWVTVTEEQNDHFELSRSYDGANWETIAQIDGAGNSTSTLLYEFEDLAVMPQGNIVYYELTQVDFNGDSHTFDVLSIDLENTTDLLLYPVPTKSYLNVKSKKDISAIVVSDALGKDLSAYVQLEYISEYHVLINLESLKSGVYFVELDGRKASFIVE